MALSSIPLYERVTGCLCALVWGAALAVAGEGRPALPAPLRLEPHTDRSELLGPPMHADRWESGFATDPTGRVGGQLPEGWTLRPVWDGARISLESRKLELDAVEGSGAWRLQLTDISNAFVDLMLGVPLDKEGYHRVQLFLRSPSTNQITIGVVAPDNPGRMIWDRRRIGVAAEWQPLVLVIPPQPRASGPLTLVVRLHDPGILDLDDLRIWRMEADDLNIGLEQPGANALPNSRFPDGIPSGWSFRQRDSGDTGVAESDPTVIAPSGVAALRMTTRGHSELTSPPMPIAGGRPVVVRFQARGAREGQVMEVQFGPPDRLRQQRVTLNTEWTQHQLVFTPDPPSDGFMLARWRVFGETWLDSLQVTSPRQREFAPAGDLELSLRPVRKLGVHVGGEPVVEARYVVSGADLSGVVLSGVLEDMSGRGTPVGPIAVDAATGSGDLVVRLPEHAPFGSFRLELVAERAGYRSRVMETLLHRVRPPRAGTAPMPESHFGAHLLPTRDQAELAKRLGFNWVRLHDPGNAITKWYLLEREKGVLTFDRADELLQRYLDAGLSVLGLLDTSPTWHSRFDESTRSGNYYQDALWVPENLDAWEAYCEAVIRHFRGRIEHWEVWNEPYVGMFFTRNFDTVQRRRVQGTPDDYLPLLVRARQAQQRANPGSKLLWSTGTAYRPNQSWHERAVELGAPNYADAFTFHLYTTRVLGGADDVKARDVEKYRAGVAGTPLENAEIWNTEGGPGSSLNSFYRHLPPFDSAARVSEQADQLVRYHVASLMHGVRRFFLYSLHAWGDWRPTWSVMGPDGSLPPLGTALSNLFWNLEGADFVRVGELSGGTGRVAAFARGERVILVVLPVAPLADLPAGALDLYGNPWHPDSPLAVRTAYLEAGAGEAAGLWLALTGTDY